ncbi:YheC/YheD family protein [Paenibacillus lentus]|uniref:YheC/YheD family protein n=1 Tax=Paenibacillus lentus TaxID=1338368 RepID=A0A3Q8SCQ9_9BACL|nr:YheC/YheD family protein [Paenibacillus lentus]AZK47562.1 YheC/YheD family protein [Paenibacillus lentus]
MSEKKPRSTVVSKWAKTKVLVKCKKLLPFIPDTQKFSESTLKKMLELYSMVYVKPEIGTYGKGVIRAELLKPNHFTYQIESTERSFKDYKSFYNSIQNYIQKKRYIIQRGIHLLKYNKRHFDIRVMVQLNPEGKWETTGLIGRVAHPKKIVTNYHSGGTPIDIKPLLAVHISNYEIQKIIHTLNELGESTAKSLHKKYPGLKQIGLDIGFDRTWTPWIIEVNTKPDPYIFNKLADKSMYRKVIRYKKAAAKV